MSTSSRRLGASPLSVFPIGLGCMSLSGAYGQSADADGIRVVHHAIERGVTLLDSSDMYGWGHNETLLGQALSGGWRDKVVLATKFGQTQRPGGANGVDGRPEYVVAACDASLRRLGVDTIDLYYQHRVDPRVPIEETVGEMVRLKEEGKIRHLGLSEASADTVRRAHKVHPIAAVQSEYSLWTRDFEADVIPACAELGITFVPYSPLGRGFLTGTITKPEDLEENDWRRQSPRFQPENLERNSALAARVKAVADELLCTPAQVALAWVLAKGPDMVPIPGTKRVRYLEDNVGATKVTLSPQHIEALDGFETAGARYAPMGMEYVNG